MQVLSLSEFRTLLRQNTPELRNGDCVEVVADGEHIGFFIVGSQQLMRDRVRSYCGIIDAGKSRQEVGMKV